LRPGQWMPPQQWGVSDNAGSGALALTSEPRAAGLQGPTPPPRIPLGSESPLTPSDAKSFGGFAPPQVTLDLEHFRDHDVRVQLENIEGRLRVHMQQDLQNALQRERQILDRARDNALNRIESRLGAMEEHRPRTERRLSELSGKISGIVEEFQMQLRKTEVADSRFLELWHQFNEADHAMRTRLAEVDQAGEKRLATMQGALTTNGDMLQGFSQRLMRLEGLLEAHGTQHQDSTDTVRESMELLHSRLGKLESGLIMERVHENVHDGVNVEAVRIATEEQAMNLQELSQRVSMLQEHLYDLVSRVETQEEHYKSLRSALATKDEQHRSLLDRLEMGDWDGRLRELQKRVGDFGQSYTAQGDNLQILQHRLQIFEQTQVQICLYLRGSTPSPVVEAPTAGSSSLPMASAQAETAALETQHAAEEVSAPLAELPPRLAEMDSLLHIVAPKVAAHETSISQLRFAIDSIEEAESLQHARLSSLTANLTERVRKIEDELKSLGGKVGSLPTTPHSGDRSGTESAHQNASEDVHGNPGNTHTRRPALKPPRTRSQTPQQ